MNNIYQNKHHANLIVRQLDSGEYINACGSISLTVITDLHWQKIKYLVWFRLVILLFISNLPKFIQYRMDKKLGLVNPMNPSEYWKMFPPKYETKLKKYNDRGISYMGNSIELRVPFWRETFHITAYEKTMLSFILDYLNRLIK